jgi:hypothetical protein
MDGIVIDYGRALENRKDEFRRLLVLLKARQATIEVLVNVLDGKEIEDYLSFCDDLLQPNYLGAESCLHDIFTVKDEAMLRILDNNHVLDSIRILALKYRIKNSTRKWLDCFCQCGGVSVLVETIDNCLNSEPVDYCALHETMGCIRHVICNHSLDVVTSTRGAMHACVMALDFEQPLLAIQVLELLNTICDIASNDVHAPTEIYSSLRQLARKSCRQQSLKFLIDGICAENVTLRFSTLLFINRLMLRLDLNDRCDFRMQLVRAGLPVAIEEASNTGHLTNHSRRRTSTDKGNNNNSVYPACDEAMNIKAMDVYDEALIFLTDIFDCGLQLHQDHITITKQWKDEDDDGMKVFSHSIPLTSIADVAGFTTDDCMQCTFEHNIRLTLRNGTQLTLGFHDRDRWSLWLNAVETSWHQARVRLSIWSESMGNCILSVEDASSLWCIQVEVYMMLLENDKKLILSFKEKDLDIGSHAVVDFALASVHTQLSLKLHHHEDVHEERRLVKVVLGALSTLLKSSSVADTVIVVESKEDELVAPAGPGKLRRLVNDSDQYSDKSGKSESVSRLYLRALNDKEFEIQQLQAEVDRLKSLVADPTTSACSDPFEGLLTALPEPQQRAYKKYVMILKAGNVDVLSVKSRMIIENLPGEVIQHLLNQHGKTNTKKENDRHITFSNDAASSNSLSIELAAAAGKLKPSSKIAVHNEANCGAHDTKVSKVSASHLSAGKFKLKKVVLAVQGVKKAYSAISSAPGGIPAKGKAFSETDNFNPLRDAIDYYGLDPIEVLRNYIVGMKPEELPMSLATVLLENFPTSDDYAAIKEKCRTEEDKQVNETYQVYSVLESIPRCQERLKFHSAVFLMHGKLPNLISEVQSKLEIINQALAFANDCKDDIAALLQHARKLTTAYPQQFPQPGSAVDLQFVVS